MKEVPTNNAKPKHLKYRLVKDTLYRFWFSRREYMDVLRAGEVCVYFSHSDTYLFESRDNVVPFFNRGIVENTPEFFEPIIEEQST